MAGLFARLRGGKRPQNTIDGLVADIYSHFWADSDEYMAMHQFLDDYNDEKVMIIDEDGTHYLTTREDYLAYRTTQEALEDALRAVAAE